VKPISNSTVQDIVFSYQLEWPTLEMTMVQRLGINYQVQKRHDQVPYPILARLRQRTGDPAPPPYGVNFTDEALGMHIRHRLDVAAWCAMPNFGDDLNSTLSGLQNLGFIDRTDITSKISFHPTYYHKPVPISGTGV
jgi:hypothetical protein